VQDSRSVFVSLLGQTTLGQLGVGKTLCREAGDLGTIVLDCGEGSEIGLIEACV